MLKKLSILFTALIIAVSCETEYATAIVNQEKNIDNYISGNLSNYEVVRNGGANRVILREGQGDPAARGDSVTFLYNGYVLGTNGPQSQFASDSTAVEIGNGKLVKGLEDGICGMKKGEESVILFTAEYGYGKENVGLVPEQSAIMFQVYIKELKKNNR